MNKRGQIIELGFVLIVLGMAIYGASTIYFQKDVMYVGDTLELKAYKYSDCKEFINSFPNERLIVFPSVDSVPQTYNKTSCD